MLFGQADVVKHRSQIDQFGIEPPAAMPAPQRSPQVYPDRMMEQQLRLAVADQLGRLAGESAVGNFDVGNVGGHGETLLN